MAKPTGEKFKGLKQIGPSKWEVRKQLTDQRLIDVFSKRSLSRITDGITEDYAQHVFYPEWMGLWNGQINLVRQMDKMGRDFTVEQMREAIDRMDKGRNAKMPVGFIQAVSAKEVFQERMVSRFDAPRPNPQTEIKLNAYLASEIANDEAGAMTEYQAHMAEYHPETAQDDPSWLAGFTMFKSMRLRTLMELEKQRRLTLVNNMNVADPEGFKALMFTEELSRQEPPIDTISKIYADFLETNHHIRDDKEERAKFDRVINSLIDFLGDVPANKLRKPMAKKFVITMGEYPKNRDRKSANMKFQDAIAYHKAKGEYRALSELRQRVWLRSISRVFEDAMFLHEHLTNPFAGMERFINGRESVEKRNFSPDEIAALFADERFNKPWDHQAWAMILLLFHGGRAGEWCNQPLNGVAQDKDGVWYLNVTKALAKNKQSIRHVPIHQWIIDQGFIRDWVLPLKARGEPWLFPGFTRTGRIIEGVFHKSKKPSAQFSQYFGRVLDAITTDETVTLHSFRHTWVSTAATFSHIKKVYRTAVVGHAASKDEEEDIHDGTYTHFGGTMTELKEQLDKVTFKGFPYERFAIKIAA